MNALPPLYAALIDNLLAGVESILWQLVHLLPRLFLAGLLLACGWALASKLQQWLTPPGEETPTPQSTRLAQGVYYGVLALAVLAALAQLPIRLGVVEPLLLVAAGGAALALGLSVGLGSRELVGGLLAGYYLRRQMQAGDQVQVAGYQGTVREIGPTATIIETEEEGLMQRHSIPNHRMLQEAVR